MLRVEVEARRERAAGRRGEERERGERRLVDR